MSKVGKVWLVGAGPGDPGLFTRKGREVLAKADVILYDRLVNPGILLAARPGVLWIDAGKTPRGKRMEQGEIHRNLIRYARKGMRVVRCKGGDPFVFGRGGEEAEALWKAKIPFEVVSGVTAGIAAPAYAGIPVTQRGVSTELSFRLGSRAEGSVHGKTLVGYMSVEVLEEFLQTARDRGFSSQTPAAIVQQGTTHCQKVVIGTVRNLAALAKKSQIRPPAVVVVGDVVNLRKNLQWWEKRKLAGKRIVLTGSEQLGQGWREALEEHGAEVWEIPMGTIEAIPPQPSWRAKIRRANWLVFTSAAAARLFPAIVGDWRLLGGCKFAAVGKMNAKVLSSIGIEADWIGRGPGSRELAEGWPKWATGKVLHLTGSAGDGSFVQRLRKKGVQAERLVVYRNTAHRSIQRPVQEALRREGADWVVFASGSAAVRFRKVMPKGVGKMKVLAIGPATARTAKSVGWRVKSIATEPSAMGVLRAILKVT